MSTDSTFLRVTVGASAHAELLAPPKPRRMLERLLHGGEADEAPIPRGREEIDAEWKSIRAKFEATRGSAKVIYIIHDTPEIFSASTTAWPYLTTEQATDVVSAIRSADRFQRVELVLHTFGGDAVATEMIAEALVKRIRTTAFVPFYAMSAGTEIALSTRLISMNKFSSLGPIDLQIGGVPASIYEQLVKEKGIKDLDDHTAILALMAQKAAKRDVGKACSLISWRHKRIWDRLRRKCTLAEQLTSGDMIHSHRIDIKQARHMGIRARANCPNPVTELVEARRRQLRQLRSLES